MLTPCLVLAYLWQTDNIYWLVISVFFMMIPFTEYTMQRVRQRVFGTMAGIVLSFILFTIFPDFTSRVVIMTVANFLIYAADGYGPTVAFITCSALALQSIDSNIPVVLTQRLIYTLLGGGIALLSNRYVFPIRLQKQCNISLNCSAVCVNNCQKLVSAPHPGMIPDGTRSIS